MSTKWTTLAMKLPRTVPSLGAMPPVVYPNEVISLILLKMPFVLGFVFFFFLSTIVLSKFTDELYTQLVLSSFT